jgi:hypothetical protein
MMNLVDGRVAILTFYVLIFLAKNAECRWSEAMMTNTKGQELAEWLVETEQIQEYTGLEGKHELMNVRKLYTQVVSGVNYKFLMEMLVGGNEVFFSPIINSSFLWFI